MISMEKQVPKLLYCIANLCLVIESLLDVCSSELDAGTDWPLRVKVPPCSEALKGLGVRRKIKKASHLCGEKSAHFVPCASNPL